MLNKGGGERRVEVAAGLTISEGFDAVCAMMGEEFKRRVLERDGSPRSLINVYVNGKNSRFLDAGTGTRLAAGDEVYVLPAVAGGSGGELSQEELDRYSRQVMLEQIGYAGQLKLRSSTACLVGAGGLGSPIAMRLVAMGVGTLRIIDRDTVERSNLHRQVLFEDADVGRIKVEAAAEKLRRMNPTVRVEPIPMSVNSSTAAEAVAGCSVVVDALDSVEARYALNMACVEAGTPFVTGAAVGVAGQAFTVVPGESACYRCVFPALDEDKMPACSVEGVHPPILSIIGGVEAAEASKVMLGQKPSLSGRILHVDLDGLDFSFTRTFRAPECPDCGIGAEAAGGGAAEAEAARPRGREEMVVEELCGRGRGKRTFSLAPSGAAPDIDVGAVSRAASRLGYAVENLGEMGLSVRSGERSASLTRRGTAVVVGCTDEDEAVRLYNGLLGAAT